MERKLELKDIACYLPYGLETTTDRTSEIHTIYCMRDKYFYITGFDGIILIEFCKPILRPLSDLYKTIIHNGKEIVPIVELAKIAFPRHKHFILRPKNGIRDERCVLFCGNLDLYDFEYNSIDSAFYCFGSSSGFIREYKLTPNQYQLFDYLNELKIDYRGLIDVGLAIDCNTLDINPYK